MTTREIAEQIFLAGVESVVPSRLIPSVLTLDNNVLKAGPLNFILDKIKNIYVIGAGKASAAIAHEVENILENRITEGQIIVKNGFNLRLKYCKVTEAGHPVPDSNGIKATAAIIEIVKKAGPDDLVISLLSGGGSALLTDLPEGCSDEEMMILNNILINCGAGISEINAVRKHLSYVKGGQLARAIYPATSVNLILSDVPGNHYDVIASGPTSPDPTTFRQAYEVLQNYDLLTRVPSEIVTHLKNGIDGRIKETPKPDDAIFEKVHNLIIGSNKIALEAARLKSLEFNYNPILIDDKLQGDAVSVAGYLVKTALDYQTDGNEVKPVCLLFGGETTVRMNGKGLGGRNQHLVLLASQMLTDQPGITILSAGTDGNDGPTDAAGAVADSETSVEALKRNIDTEKFISAFDSYHFFKKAGGHIITGPTMTNVMDLIVVIVE